jgi:hypothetical protein
MKLARMPLAATLSRWFSRTPPNTRRAVPFKQLLRAWERRVADFPWEPAQPQPGARRVAVLVTPWLGTSVPFFNLEIARMLAGAGDAVQVVFDPTNAFGNARSAAEIDGIERSVAALPDGVRVESARDWPEAVPTAEDIEFARSLIYENGVWRMRGESRAAEFVARKEPDVERLAAHIRRVEEFIAGAGLDWLLVPGGVWGLSSIYVRAAQRAGLAFATYDSGKCILIVCQNGVAAHQSDLPAAFARARKYCEKQPALRERAIEWSRRELDDRIGGRGNYNTFQAQAATGRADGEFNVLVPLNLRWDSAALGRQRLFASFEEWLGAIVDWAATEPRAHVCIRQHPIERRAGWRSSDDPGTFVRRRNRAGERVRFIAADEPTNTYDLLGGARVVLPYTSSMAMEAGMLGIPVVTSAQNYYEDFGFVARADSPTHYFDAISRAIRGELTLSSDARDEAALVYFLTQHCNLMKTPFTAESVEFCAWVRIPPAELWRSPEAMDLQRSLRTGEPLASIRFQRLAASAA